MIVYNTPTSKGEPVWHFVVVGGGCLLSGGVWQVRFLKFCEGILRGYVSVVYIIGVTVQAG